MEFYGSFGAAINIEGHMPVISDCVEVLQMISFNCTQCGRVADNPLQGQVAEDAHSDVLC